MDGDHKMEHRWSVRKPVNVGVALRRQGSNFKRFKTRDLSMEGVFAESGPDSVAGRHLSRVGVAALRK